MIDHKSEPELQKPEKTLKHRATKQKKSFRELFDRSELIHYGIAALVYIGLGILTQNWVLNVGVGTIFIVGWMWIVPPLIDKLRGKMK